MKRIRLTNSEEIAKQRAAWRPRERQLGEVGPRTTSILDGEYNWVADTPQVARRGAQDFLQVASVGVAT